MDIGTLIASLGADITGLARGGKKGEQILKKYSSNTTTELNKVDKKWKKSGDNIEASLKKIGGLVVTYLSVTEIANWGSEIVKAGIRVQSLENALMAVTGTMSSARGEMVFIKNAAHDLGLSLRPLEDSYKTLAAASINTKLEGQGARDVFYAIAEASTAMQLTATQSHAALYALQQMMSKGRVQTEELRRQLGEQLPGAFQIAAEAMGITTAELNKMLELGLVVSEDFLPKFAKVMDERFGAAAIRNAELARGSFNRFGNAVEQLKRTLADSGVLDFFADLAKASTTVIELLDKGIGGQTLREQMDIALKEEARLLDLRERANEQRNIELNLVDRIKKGANALYNELYNNNVEFKSTIEELSGFSIVDFEKTEEGISRIFRVNDALEKVQAQIQELRDKETILRLASAKEGINNIDNLVLSFKEVLRIIDKVDKKNTKGSYEKELENFAKLWISIDERTKELTLSSFEYEKMMLKRKLTSYQGHGLKKNFLDKWYFAELKKLINENNKKIKEDNEKAIKEAKKTAEAILKSKQQANQELYKIDIELAEKVQMDSWYARDEGYKKAKVQAEDYITWKTQNDYDEEQKAIKKREKLEEQAKKDQKEAYKHMYYEVHDIAADFWGKILDGQIRSWDDFMDHMLNSFKKTFAQILAQASTPILMGIAGGVFGVSGSSSDGGIGGKISSTITSKIVDKLGGTVMDKLGIPKLSSFLGGSSMATTGAGVGYSSYGIPVADAAAMGSVAPSLMSSAGMLGVGAFGAAIMSKIFEAFTESSPAFSFMGNDLSLAAYDGRPNIDEAPFTTVAPVTGVKSQNYDYRIAVKDFDGSTGEVQTAMFTYFDHVFSQLDEITSTSINDTLKDFSYYHAGEKVGGGDFETSFAKMSKDIFTDMVGTLLIDILPDAGTIQETYEAVVGNRTESYYPFSQQAFTGRDFENQQIDELRLSQDIQVPIYEEMTRQISSVADRFNTAFFNAIIPEGGNEWDAFIRFGLVVQDSSNFMEDFTRQVEEFGEITSDAFLNIESINSIMSSVNETAREFDTSNLDKVLIDVNAIWETLTDTLQEAHAVTTDLNRAQTLHNRAIGEQVTGLTGESVFSMITSGQSVSEGLTDNLWNKVVDDMMPSIMRRFINPLTRDVGIATEKGGIEGAIAALPGILDYLDFEELTTILEDAQTQFNEFFGITDELTDEIDELITAEEELASARQDAAKSIEDLIREIEGSTLSPVQSIEWFEQQYRTDLAKINKMRVDGTPEELAQAVSNLTSSAPDFLDFAQDYGGNYLDTYQNVLDTLRNVDMEQGFSNNDITVNVYIGNEQLEGAVVEVLENSSAAQSAVERIT